MTNTLVDNTKTLQDIEFNLHNIQMHMMAIKRDNPTKNDSIDVYLKDVDHRVDLIRALLKNIH